MFKRKKKKTGIQTPEFRKPTLPPKPPKPPTSGSNAIKPSCNCGHQPTYTSTQNPPDTFSSLLKATSLQILPNDISTITYVCPYETPCGWCTKWDKKCDRKIGGYPTVSDQVQKKVTFEKPPAPACSDCIHFTSISSVCLECGAQNDYKFFKAKVN